MAGMQCSISLVIVCILVSVQRWKRRFFLLHSLPSFCLAGAFRAPVICWSYWIDSDKSHFLNARGSCHCVEVRYVYADAFEGSFVRPVSGTSVLGTIELEIIREVSTTHWLPITQSSRAPSACSQRPFSLCAFRCWWFDELGWLVHSLVPFLST